MGLPETPSTTLDTGWASATALTLAGNTLTAARGYVGASRLRTLSPGLSAADATATLTRTINGAGVAGVGLSVMQGADAWSQGDNPGVALSTVDAVMGVAAFIPGPDAAALAYGITRIVGDVAYGRPEDSKQNILDAAGEMARALRQAGCQ